MDGWLLVFRLANRLRSAREQDGDRGAGARGFTDEWRLRVFLGNNDKVFIIYVDQTVGSAITMFMRDVSKERPLTHDLMAHLMTALGAHVERSSSTISRTRPYYARMIIRAENELQQKKIVELGFAAERLHRDGGAAEGADLRQPGSLGRSRRHERRPPQDGRGRPEAGSGDGVERRGRVTRGAVRSLDQPIKSP
jgi:hypothetical protein